MFCMYQIRKRKRKSRAYEVASQVQTEDRCITSIEAMSRNENSNDWWLQTNTSIMILLILICGQMIFLTKPVMTNVFIFIEKYWKKNLCLNIKPVYRKRILGFDKKENYNLEKSFIWASCWIPTIVWNVLHQYKHQGQQKE